MATVFSNLFSNDELEQLFNLPEVIAAKEQINEPLDNDTVYFTVPLTESIKNVLVTRLGLDAAKISQVSQLPMRWIKGDTAPHFDRGPSKFENTYLAYINSNPGEFIVDNAVYPITANTGYVFNEGLTHMTKNTGVEPRLLMGPMNEFVQPVGVYIDYYRNYADALAKNTNFIAYSGTYVLGDVAGGSIGNITSWRVASVSGLGPIPSGVYNNGFDLSTFGQVGYYVYPSIPCFLEGTKILCNVNEVDEYVPIETLKPGALVKTTRDGYKKVELIGKANIINPGNEERTENRLYKCSPENYPELTEDLYITGCHSILVPQITDEQRAKIIEHSGRVFITDNNYRLVAHLDQRAHPWNSEGTYNIWHIALEHDDERMNYGVYANGGLLVETCSKRYLKHYAGMTVEGNL
jgi:hypothetical protein